MVRQYYSDITEYFWIVRCDATESCCSINPHKLQSEVMRKWNRRRRVFVNRVFYEDMERSTRNSRLPCGAMKICLDEFNNSIEFIEVKRKSIVTGDKMKFRFKPEDFGSRNLDGISGGISIEWAAQKANALLEAHEKTLPRVYAKELPGKSEYYNWSHKKRMMSFTDTHTALLWGIEEMK